LGQIGPAAIPALVKTFKKDDPNARMWAAQALAFMGPDAKDAVSDLVGLLKDKDDRVRISAITALGQIGPDAKTAVPDLTEILKDRKEYLRIVAAMALMKIKQPGVGADKPAHPGGMGQRLIPVDRETQLDQLINLVILGETGKAPGPPEQWKLILQTFYMVVE